MVVIIGVEFLLLKLELAEEKVVMTGVITVAGAVGVGADDTAPDEALLDFFSSFFFLFFSSFSAFSFLSIVSLLHLSLSFASIDFLSFSRSLCSPDGRRGFLGESVEMDAGDLVLVAGDPSLFRVSQE